MKAFSQSTLGHRAGIAAHVLRVGFPPLIIALIARRRPLVRKPGNVLVCITNVLVPARKQQGPGRPQAA